ncbi:TonB-dependent vitamin B12 receptor [Xanthomonas albilineans]|uniref:TonB-dependent vitamin B12 receptor n=1 Tax=Xanthomonas albilineans TaxID=29447 RepID=UPI0005F2FF2C|nr:TonB-dependent vitamin B12 receptor [Xanthomonas albilineans]
MSSHLLSVAIASALFLPSLALAADAANDLDQVLVTATRTQIAVEDSVVPAQVIGRAEIERSQADSLAQLLQGRAGIGISNQGGLGKLTTLNLRGSESDHVLVLVDGVRIGSASAGLAAFQDLPLSQIERIEIVRGPRSSLYGSDAIGGVIQIFTRHAGQGFQQNLSLGSGSDGLRDASAGFSNRGTRGWLAVQSGYQKTRGINACNGSATLFAGCFVDQPDRDGYRNVSLSARGGYALSDTLRVAGQALNIDSRNAYDGDPVYAGNEADNTQQVFGGTLDWTPSERLHLSTQLGRNVDDAHSYYRAPGSRTRSFVSTFDSRRDTAAAQGDITLTEGHLLSVGSDWQREQVTSTTAFDVDSRRNTGVFAEYQGHFGAQQLQASVRSDDNQQFGEHTTGSLGWGLALGGGVKLTASIGTGFKAPTFNDLYFPFAGNPALKPEKSKSGNLGVAQCADTWNWTFNAYETRVDDLISYDAATFLPVNVDEARIRGAELTGYATLAGWELSAQLSHTDPRNRSDGDNRDNWLARRPHNTGRLDVDRGFGPIKFGITAFGSGHRYDDAANQVRLGGYGTVDLRVEYAFAADWTLQAKASNVFDRRYQTVNWYNQLGREYGLTLRYAPAAR